jgi:hypothetical protein
MTGRGRSGEMPWWVKALMAVAALLVVLMVVGLLSGQDPAGV